MHQILVTSTWYVSDGTNWLSIGRNTNLFKETIYLQRIQTTVFHTVIQYSTAPIK